MTALQVHDRQVQDRQLQAQARPVDGRRSLLQALEFLTERGVSPDVICLAMVRAGISLEVARVLSQCVVTSQPALPAPVHPTPTYGSAAAERALRALVGVLVTLVLYLGLGLVLGFTLGMELGLAQGVEQGIGHVLRLVGL